jgi:hypothetical protein
MSGISRNQQYPATSVPQRCPDRIRSGDRSLPYAPLANEEDQLLHIVDSMRSLEYLNDSEVLGRLPLNDR